MTYGEEDRFSVCSEVSSVQDLEDPPPNMLHTLLSEIYTQYQWSSGGLQTPVFDSNIYDDLVLQDNCLVQRTPISHLTEEELQDKSVDEIKLILKDLELRTKEQSSKLIGFLRRRDQGKTRQKRGYALLTRLLQTIFKKKKSNGVPIRLKFCMPAPTDPRQFNNWLDALRALAQVPPYGIDPIWRPSVWLGCAEFAFDERFKNVEWENVLKFAFNEKLNPDDHMLGVQIVKDLHRTGSCRLLSPSDDRAALKRVLLAYARWNKEVGYCQGFNIITSVLLKVLNNNEHSALKVMIHVVEYLLPEHYFNNNLIALSVDLAVFRELLRHRLPRLWNHITKLQGPISNNSDVTKQYEPPLTNVFTMQWFLTLFATCLPNEVALKIWDLIFLYGAEVLFRVALSIWSALQFSVLQTHSCDEFYGLMSTAVIDIQEGRLLSCETLMKKIHSIPPLSHSKLCELREEIMYNIQPPNLGLYTNNDNDVNCMSLLMSNKEQPEIRTDPSKPSLRETIQKREVEVTAKDISNLLSKYKAKAKIPIFAEAGQPVPATIACAPDLGRRKPPQKAFSFDTSELPLQPHNILLQQNPGFSSALLQSPTTPIHPRLLKVPSSPVRKSLFKETDPEELSPKTTRSSFSTVTDALAHIRVSRIPDTPTDEFCNSFSAYSFQKPIPEKSSSSIQAQTQSYQELESPVQRSELQSKRDDDEVYFVEDDRPSNRSGAGGLSAIEKRKMWANKSLLMYKSKDEVLPVPPYKTGSLSFECLTNQYSEHTITNHSNSNGNFIPSSVIATSTNGSLNANSVSTNICLNRHNSVDSSYNVTRVVHAGQNSDPYFNLRKNQDFLADMYNSSLANATSLPFTVSGSNIKNS